MSTVQNIIDRAVERSNLNDADLLPTTELINYVSLYEKRAFLTAANNDPDFFGREGLTAVRSTGGSWSLSNTPGNVAAVSRVEVASISGTVPGVSVGDKVNLVSLRNPELEIAPRAYVRNKVLYEYNDELTSGANFVTRCNVFYSYLPPTRTATSDTLDLPEELDNIVILPLAILLALRDQRPDEAAPLLEEFQIDWNTFLGEVGGFDEGATRDLAAVAAAIPGA